MTKYPLPDNFSSDAAKHCAALFIFNANIGRQPTENDLNATITFIEYKNKTYGITCKHVIDIYKNKESFDKNTCFATLTNGTHFIFNDFILPPNDFFMLPEPDIAIRQICPDFPQIIGKIPIKLENNSINTLGKIQHAVAVGFPTKEKRPIDAKNGYRITMPCVHVLAKISSINKDSGQLSLYSELDHTVQIKDFSGMSGGPVFWSTEKDYGLLGIMYEALPPNPSENSLGESPRIVIKAELVTSERFKNWVAKFPELSEDKHWIKKIKCNFNINP